MALEAMGYKTKTVSADVEILHNSEFVGAP